MYHEFGYESHMWDGAKLSFSLCQECSDKFAGVLRAMFTYDPIEDPQY